LDFFQKQTPRSRVDSLLWKIDESLDVGDCFECGIAESEDFGAEAAFELLGRGAEGEGR
jgi:hypothetical protein